jgi:hypothetical protein
MDRISKLSYWSSIPMRSGAGRAPTTCFSGSRAFTTDMRESGSGGTPFKEPWEYFESHVQRVLAGGDKVVTVVRFEAVGKESGAKVELPFLTNVVELKDGLIVKFNAYYSLAEALDAAGLSEQDDRTDW